MIAATASGGDAASRYASLTAVTIRRRSPPRPKPAPEETPPVSLPLPGGIPAPGRPPASPQHLARKSDPGNTPQELTAYWLALAGARRWPLLPEIDGARVARHWPTAALMAVDGDHVQLVRRFGTGGQGSGTDTVTPAMLEWLADLCRDCAALRAPMRRFRVFGSAGGLRRMRAAALPFGADDRTVDYVLCEIVGSS